MDSSAETSATGTSHQDSYAGTRWLVSVSITMAETPVDARAWRNASDNSEIVVARTEPFVERGVDFRQARPGRSVVGVVLDRSTPTSFAEFEQAARKVPGCLECHLVAGEFDYFLIVRTKDLERFNKLHADEILTLPGVRQIRTFFVVKQILSTTELPV